MSDPLRFFVPAVSLQSDQVIITGEPYHHLRKVLRIKPGAIILLLDGLGHCCQIQLEQLQSEQATTRVLRRWQEIEATLPITLMQALPKGDKFDLVLQKGTELGVSCFQPIETAHAVPNLTAARLSKREQRWQRIVSEAARQSRRIFLPKVQPLQKLQSALDVSTGDLKLVLWEAGSVALANVLPKVPPHRGQAAHRPGRWFFSRGNHRHNCSRISGGTSWPTNSTHRNCRLGSDPHLAVSLWRLADSPCRQ